MGSRFGRCLWFCVRSVSRFFVGRFADLLMSPGPCYHPYALIFRLLYKDKVASPESIESPFFPGQMLH